MEREGPAAGGASGSGRPRPRSAHAIAEPVALDWLTCCGFRMRSTHRRRQLRFARATCGTAREHLGLPSADRARRGDDAASAAADHRRLRGSTDRSQPCPFATAAAAPGLGWTRVQLEGRLHSVPQLEGCCLQDVGEAAPGRERRVGDRSSRARPVFGVGCRRRVDVPAALQICAWRARTASSTRSCGRDRTSLLHRDRGLGRRPVRERPRSVCAAHEVGWGARRARGSVPQLPRCRPGQGHAPTQSFSSHFGHE
jgi:hypothetical protein